MFIAFALINIVVISIIVVGLVVADNSVNSYAVRCR